MRPSSEIARLLEIMAALRHPQTGCPWDIEQDFNSIAPYTIEEAYEVADAIERGDWEDLRDELGDLLLQPIFHARMAEEAGLFNFDDVVMGITQKMIRRHPHVFGNDTARGAPMAKGAWENIKALENEEKANARKVRGVANTKESILDGVPAILPALQTASKLQKKAAQIGFDWDNPKPVLAKIHEELAELNEAMDIGDKKAVEAEIGDLLFSVANLARHLAIEPDHALRSTNVKFRRRFAYIEAGLEQQEISLKDATLQQMDDLWDAAKKQENNSTS